MEGNVLDLSNGLRVSIDWLSFTVTDGFCLEDIIEFLGYDPDDFSAASYGSNGYKSMLILNNYNLRILYDGNEDMGIHVSISGSAISESLRSFKENLKINTPFGIWYDIDFNSTFLIEFLKAIRKIGHLTRVDLAIDDIGAKYFTTDDIVQLYDDDKIVSKFRCMQNVVKKQSREKIGHTVYFGSRSSKMFLRIYDKQLEQNEGIIDSDKLVSVPWVRWELECKKDRANQIADLLINGESLGEVVIGVLSRYFRVINLDNNNRTRCSTYMVWDAFLNGISSLSLYMAEAPKTLADKENWIMKQVAPSLCAVILSHGGDMQFIEYVLCEGRKRMNRQLWKLVSEEYSLQRGGDDMTLGEAFEDFLYTKEVDGLKPGSIKNYRVTIGYFLDSMGLDTPLETISLKMVQEYTKSLLNGSVARATAASYIRNIRIFLRWCYREYDSLQFNPIKIKQPKSPKKNVHIYKDDEIRLILEMIKTSVSWITARNRAAISLMLDTGIRQAEICSLQKINIDRERHMLKVTGKGDKDRFVHVGDFALRLLDEYLSMCPYKDSKYAFIDRRGHMLSGNAIRLFVNRLQKQLPFELSSHKLRHNYATNFCIDSLERTGQTCVQDLGILMGHESIETTKRYEHFAHELVAAKNAHSHLDQVFKP